MANGTSQCEGQVEMNIFGHWKTLCASHWDEADANVVCRQLGCGVAISAPKVAHPADGGDRIWKARFHCSGAESFLWSCPVTALGAPACPHGDTASVICSGERARKLVLRGRLEWTVPESGECGRAASEGTCFMVKYGSSHHSFIFQIRARSVTRNNIF